MRGGLHDATLNPKDLAEVMSKAQTKNTRRVAVGSSDLPVTRPKGNLPLELTSFVGRERELAEVGVLSEGTRLLTLVGVGGSGKTRLALRTAARLDGQFADGAW